MELNFSKNSAHQLLAGSAVEFPPPPTVVIPYCAFVSDVWNNCCQLRISETQQIC